MAKVKPNFETVTKYYFKKKGVVEEQGYDWIGEACFELYPVELDGKLGFADINGKIVIDFIYDRDRNIMRVERNGIRYLRLAKNNLQGLIKTDGSVAVDFCWNEIQYWNLNEDLVPVALEGKWGFVNVKTGQTQVKPAYDEVKPFFYGFAPVQINDKWGIIDVNGNVIVKIKYLVDFYFHHDFAIAHTGGSVIYTRGGRVLKDSNWKIINKKGFEIVSGCYEIRNTGVNIYTITRKRYGKLATNVKQFIPISDYIVVVENGDYLSGHITRDGTYSKKIEYYTDIEKCSPFYEHAKYIGGGTWSAIDYAGNPIMIPEKDLQKVKESLLTHGVPKDIATKIFLG